ncbi:MAG TPA: GNAT family N-acetyltransferase, partial [Gaiellaceae bacterium]
RFVLMVNRELARPDASRPDSRGRRTDASTAYAEAIRHEPHGRDELLVQQLLEHRRLIQRAVPTRLFAALAEGRLVSHCELYSAGGVGQVENVATLPAFRGRGLATALVECAVSESRAGGNELTFLVAGADDWPKLLYEKLGFEIVGRYARYLRRL